MSEKAFTQVTSHDDGSFLRTALVISEGVGGSIDILNSNKQLLVRINVFAKDGETDWVAVDVIDVEDQFTDRRVLAFVDGQRETLNCSRVAAVDFSRRVIND